MLWHSKRIGLGAQQRRTCEMRPKHPTKNKDHTRDPDMHSSKKGEQMYFGMKAHISVDADSGLVHTVRGTSGNVYDVVEGNVCCTGKKSWVCVMQATKG
jgi:IS5 family transposase